MVSIAVGQTLSDDINVDDLATLTLSPWMITLVTWFFINTSFFVFVCFFNRFVGSEIMLKEINRNCITCSIVLLLSFKYQITILFSLWI